MATTLADLAIRVGVDAQDATKQLDQVEKRTQSFSDRVGNMGKSVQSAGTKLTAFATVPLLGLGHAATNATSDLGESVNAIEQVFGPAAKTIKDFGETSAESVGLSTRAFNQLVTPVGAALKNVGFSADEAAQSSIDLTERAADMASVFNTDVDEALGAIQAGLRGEADPLERFGVGLSAAAVEAHAMEMGLANANGELSEQAKAQARISLLMEQTNDIAGDFAETSNSVANAERITAAEAENAAAALGEKLLPAKAKLISIASNLIDRFSNLSSTQQNWIIGIGAAVAALGPLLLVLGTLMRGISGVITIVPALVKGFALAGKAFMLLSKLLLTNPWALVIAGIVLLAVVVFKNWDKIRAFISKAWAKIKSVTSSVWSAVLGFLKKAFAVITNIFLNFTGPGLVIKHWNKIVSVIRSAGAFIVNLVRAFIARTVQHINTLRQIPGKVRDFFERAGRGAKRALTSLVDFVRNIPSRILGALGNVGSLLFSAGSNIINGMLDGIRSAAGRVLDEVRNLASRIRDFLPFSLPKEGPLRTHPVEQAGKNLMMDLGAGIEKAAPGLLSEMRGVASELGDPFRNTPTVRGVSTIQAQPQRVVLSFDGGTDSRLANVLMEMLRGGELPTFEAAGRS